MAGDRRGAPGSLTADDWLQAGYELLATDGLRALKIERLCEQIGATRGSFYWHFTDMKGYRSALVASWNSFLENDRRSLAEIEHLPPRERLSKMMEALVSPQHWTLERAMREWARSDDVAAANIRAADHRVLVAVSKAYLDYGFSPEEARLRAESTFAAGIGMLHLIDSTAQLATSDRHERFLDLMLGTTGRTGSQPSGA
ncbi:TetR/AcrR family transcriptional regulator [Mycolicibacterium wolinskyi]|uniref:TetR family transcriptional regulator n=1 Tax=Mycolicibacterium wolinskyi TaxID=59750 RepID=A0A1X2FHI5_9MYCO|nr:MULTISPECIES: TetR/AcrR family transcriptional regulator [Mycolicibacterium]MCV7284668.1 TetR/AcrR family transcriptional regulator [Mycolicibacterium wolinskyi]MCV7295230.1 TetR/AcrR family transcriptional regulator [Mycolicibacterium goodii]ORX17788.1 TetR family transcriptional regulator [Mycolicibacterium wolinskyi]